MTQPNEKQLNISIVIPTYNRRPRLERVLRALERQTHPLEDFEVVVVSDGSTDGTDRFLTNVETPLQLRPHFQENAGVAAARNRGVEQARAELILFIDDDVVPAPDLVAEHLRQHHAYQRDIVVLGPMLTPADHEMSPWVQWEQSMLYRQYNAMEQGLYEPTSRQFYTGNTSLRRDAIVEAGGFDPTFRRAEDIELGFRLERLGLKYVFCMSARGYHYAERSYESWIAIAYAYGRNTVLFTRDRGVAWNLPVTLSEFRQRNRLVRVLTRTCLDRSILSAAVFQLMRRIAVAGRRFNLTGVSLAACSGMYNLRLYQGIADELGGRDEFFQQLPAAEAFARARAQRRQAEIQTATGEK